MKLMEQELLNWAIAIIFAIVGFIMKSLWQAVKDLQDSDKEITDKINTIQILVVGDYVKASDINRLSDAIFKKLDRMESIISQKADKGDHTNDTKA